MDMVFFICWGESFDFWLKRIVYLLVEEYYVLLFGSLNTQFYFERDPKIYVTDIL